MASRDAGFKPSEMYSSVSGFHSVMQWVDSWDAQPIASQTSCSHTQNDFHCSFAALRRCDVVISEKEVATKVMPTQYDQHWTTIADHVSAINSNATVIATAALFDFNWSDSLSSSAPFRFAWHSEPKSKALQRCNSIITERVFLHCSARPIGWLARCLEHSENFDSNS